MPAPWSAINPNFFTPPEAVRIQPAGSPTSPAVGEAPRIGFLRQAIRPPTGLVRWREIGDVRREADALEHRLAVSHERVEHGQASGDVRAGYRDWLSRSSMQSEAKEAHRIITKLT